MTAAAQKLIAAVESMLGDVEGMKAKPKTLDLDDDQDPKDWFGIFETYNTGVEDAFSVGIAVEWPNLAISSADMKTALEAFKKEQAA